MKLIPKYQNEGLVTRQDNTYVAKPTIPPKLIKRTYTPTQSYVSQDNRSEWQREQGSKKADEEYKKYVKDTKLDNNMGLFFKSITDWKEAAKWLSKYATIAGVPITINNKTK